MSFTGQSSSSSSSTDVRTFRASNTRAALNAIKEALGSEAVIIQTREVGGLFGKAEVEVTAARGPRDPAPVNAGPPARGAAQAVRAYKIPVGMPATDQPHVASDLEGLRNELQRLRHSFDSVHSRLEGMEGVSATTSAKTVHSAAPMPPERAEVFRQLVLRGVDEQLATEFVGEALRKGAGVDRGDLALAVRAMVRRHLRPATAPWLRPEGAVALERRVLALVGPTGVGKTTTVAKIAARALIETHLKVVLVTVDTYRLGASDQLARYGKIMGIKTHIARDEAALLAAVAASSDADLVLIDTAGRSDGAARSAQADLIRTVAGVEVHLVLSAATGARELGAMARNYEPLRPDCLILSKIDEADGPGGVLSAASTLGRPVSCITDGQRVPEDIHAVTARELTQLVFTN